MRVAVIGAGGVGGYYGGRLAAAGLDVSFLARGAHLAALKAHGLRVDSPLGDLRLPRVTATDTAGRIGAVDVALFCVKLYDTASTALQIAPLIGPDTIILCLQNGVDGPALLAELHGAARVVPGTVYVVSEIAGPGHIRHSGVDRPIIGAVAGTAGDRVHTLVDAWRAAGSEAETSDQIHIEIWRKFTRLSAFSAICCACRQPVSAILHDQEVRDLFLAALDEAIAVGRATGVDLPDGFAAESLGLLAAMTPDSKPSMLRDLEAGRRMELPWLSGTIVRLGARHGVPTPVHDFCRKVLHPYQDGVPGGAEAGRRAAAD